MGATKKGLGVKIKICYIQSQPIVLHSYYRVLLRCQLTERFVKKILRGISSVGRALAWHARGQRFEPAILHNAVNFPKRFSYAVWGIYITFKVGLKKSGD